MIFFKNNYNLKTKMSFILTLMVLIPILIVISIFTINSMSNIQQQVYNNNKRLATGIKDQINVNLNNVESIINTLAQTDDIKSVNPTAIAWQKSFLKKIVTNYSTINNIYIIDGKGKEIYDTSDNLSNHAETEYFKKAIEGQKNYSKISKSSQSNQYITTFAFPIKKKMVKQLE